MDAGWLRSVPGAALLRLWMQRSAQRRLLLEMDEYRLRDIGLTKVEALREGAVPFWHGATQDFRVERDPVSPRTIRAQCEGLRQKQRGKMRPVR